MTAVCEIVNALAPEAARAALERCCGSRRWVEGMLARRPFGSDPELFGAAAAVWWALERSDYLEAFAHHPRIGENIDALRAKFRATSAWSEAEQAGVNEASLGTLEALRDGNAAYFDRFGYIFIVCASGKSAEEMRALLEVRLKNPPELELRIAAGEQAKITRLRLEKLLP